jgi:hypothetical protein
MQNTNMFGSLVSRVLSSPCAIDGGSLLALRVGPGHSP